MKKEFVRQVVIFENHFKDFRKTLDRETLKNISGTYPDYDCRNNPL